MSKHTRMIETRRLIEQANASPAPDSRTSFHDDTIAHLRKCRAEADDDSARRILDGQIAIQEKRKAEAIALKDDSRRRNAAPIG